MLNGDFHGYCSLVTGSWPLTEYVGFSAEDDDSDQALHFSVPRLRKHCDSHVFLGARLGLSNETDFYPPIGWKWSVKDFKEWQRCSQGLSLWLSCEVPRKADKGATVCLTCWAQITSFLKVLKSQSTWQLTNRAG